MANKKRRKFTLTAKSKEKLIAFLLDILSTVIGAAIAKMLHLD